MIYTTADNSVASAAGPVEVSIALVVTFAVSALVTRLVLAACIRWRLFDVPTERSSHTLPTPTGGGLGLIVGLWAGFGCLLLLRSPLAVFPTWGLIAASIVMVLAIYDDLGSGFSVGQKITLQVFGALVWLALAAPLPWLSVPGWGRVEVGTSWLWLISVIWFVFLMNVYNFMDGIDGLSAVEAVTVCGWLSACLWGTSLAPFPLLIVAAVMGFWLYNRNPARIFMGDVGSLFLGLAVASVAVAGETHGVPLWVPLLLSGVYLYDVIYTLARRALRRENILIAHRQHIYQRFVSRGYSHNRIATAVAFVNAILGTGVFLILRGFHGLGLVVLAAIAALAVAVTVWIEANEPVAPTDR